MPDQLQLRGGTTTEHNSFTGALREVTVDTTKKTLVVHDGASAGGTPLMKESGSNAASTVGIGVGGANKITINSDGHVDIASNLDCAAGLDVTGAITCTGGLTVDTNTLFVNGSNNRVGVGTASPDTTLSVSGTGDGVVNIDTSDSRGAFVRFGQGGSFHNMVGCADGLTSGDKEDLGVRAADNIIFATGGSTERLRVDSSGRFLLNMSSSVTGGKFQVFNTFNTFFAALNSSQGCVLQLQKTRSTSPDGYTIVQDGDTLGELQFKGSNGSASVVGANIKAIVNGTPSSGNDLPTDLAFRLMPDGSGNTLERMRIASDGLVTIGDSASGSGAASASVGEGELVVGSQTGGLITACDLGSGEKLRIRGGGGATSLGSTSNHALIFHTNGSANERMRIDQSGGVRIGTTAGLLNGANANFEQLSIKRTGQGNPLTLQRTTAISGFPVLYLSSVDTAIASQPFITFVREVNGEPLTVVGTIQTSTSATTYGTSSDYRLKENEVPISDGITRLKTLKPYRFNWKVDPSTKVDGFFAHEVTAVPEAVIGTKDEVSTDENGAIPKGKPIYQQIDQSKLVPLLVAAVQELIGKVEALEAA